MNLTDTQHADLRRIYQTTKEAPSSPTKSKSLWVHDLHAAFRSNALACGFTDEQINTFLRS